MKKLLLAILLSLVLLLTACAPGEMLDTLVHGRTSDTTEQPIRADTFTHVLETISYPHSTIHDGDSFKADINSDDIDSEGTNNALHITFTTSNTTKWIHIIITATATGSADVSFTEAPTGGVIGGSNLSIYNRNRNSLTTSSIISTDNTTINEATQDATAPTGGTEIHHWKIGSGKNKIGGGVREIEEFILKQDTTYSIRLTANANDVRGQLGINWYEQVNRSP